MLQAHTWDVRLFCPIRNDSADDDVDGAVLDATHVYTAYVYGRSGAVAAVLVQGY